MTVSNTYPLDSTPFNLGSDVTAAEEAITLALLFKYYPGRMLENIPKRASYSYS